MKRIGIYSGTFDPVHKGHLTFARAALEKCSLDKVFFLVEPRPRRKQGVKAAQHREQMVRLAIRNKPRFGSIVLDQQRFTTHETLPVLAERFKGADLYMLMGDDWLDHFADWPYVEELVHGVRFIIGLKQRDKQVVQQKLAILEQTRGLRLRSQLLEVEKPEPSSGSIKQQLRSGQSTPELPSAVKEYIDEQGLYADSASGSK